MSAPTGYTVDPPTYTAPTPNKAYGATSTSQAQQQQPLLSGQWASGSQAPRNDWDAEGGSEDGIPEDFKVRCVFRGYSLARWAEGQAELPVGAL